MAHRIGKVTLHLPGGDLTSQGLRDIANFISYAYHAHTLEHIDFNFESTTPFDFEPSIFRPVIEAIKTLKNLKNLSINLNLSSFNWSQDNYEILKGLAKAVRHHPKLESLFVGLSSNNASEKALNEFIQALTHLPLEYLSLDLTNSTRIRAESFLRELSRLGEIRTLKELYLCAPNNQEIDDRVVNHWCAAWRGLEQLTIVQLELSRTRCTGRSIHDIAALLEQLSSHHLTVAAIGDTGRLTRADAREIFNAMESAAAVYEVSATPQWTDPLRDLNDPVRDWIPHFNFGSSAAGRRARERTMQEGALTPVRHLPVKGALLVKIGHS